MKIAIIDADLIGRIRHRFPNLVCMKISGFHKSNGDSVTLKTDYFDLESFISNLLGVDHFEKD